MSYRLSLRDAVGILSDHCHGLGDHVCLSAEFARHLCREANLHLNEIEAMERKQHQVVFLAVRCPDCRA